MEYVFGTSESHETVLIKGDTHTDWQGFHQTERDYGTESIVDNFYVVGKEWSAEDSAGNCYDRYLIDQHYRIIDKTGRVEQDITSATAELLQPLSIAFVTMAEAGSIDDVTAGEHMDMFAEWSGEGVDYAVGNLRRYNGKLYKCISAHKSQADWTPDTAVSLWVQTADPAEEWPQWSQPVGAHDAYQKDDKVTYNGEHYQSLIDGNVWKPDEYPQGWQKCE